MPESRLFSLPPCEEHCVLEGIVASSWFALHVRVRQEKTVSHILSRKGFEQFVPVYRSKRKWTDRIKELDVPLFPGYVFCRFQPEARVPVVTTPGVVDIVRCGRMLTPVDPAEIAALQALPESGHRALDCYRALAPNLFGLLGSHGLNEFQPETRRKAQRAAGGNGTVG